MIRHRELSSKIFTYALETNGQVGQDSNQMRAFKQLTKFTYTLETDERDDQIKSIKTIDQVHVRSGEVGMGCNEMVRHRVFDSKNSRTG